MLKQDTAVFPQKSSLEFIKDASSSIAAAIQCEREIIQGLTARQYAAIALRVPDSGEPWLDKMIKQARRMDAAESALPAIQYAIYQMSEKQLQPLAKEFNQQNRPSLITAIAVSTAKGM